MNHSIRRLACIHLFSRHRQVQVLILQFVALAILSCFIFQEHQFTSLMLRRTRRSHAFCSASYANKPLLKAIETRIGLDTLDRDESIKSDVSREKLRAACPLMAEIDYSILHDWLNRMLEIKHNIVIKS